MAENQKARINNTEHALPSLSLPLILHNQGTLNLQGYWALYIDIPSVRKAEKAFLNEPLNAGQLFLKLNVSSKSSLNIYNENDHEVILKVADAKRKLSQLRTLLLNQVGINFDSHARIEIGSSSVRMELNEKRTFAYYNIGNCTTLQLRPLNDSYSKSVNKNNEDILRIWIPDPPNDADLAKFKYKRDMNKSKNSASTAIKVNDDSNRNHYNNKHNQRNKNDYYNHNDNRDHRNNSSDQNNDFSRYGPYTDMVLQSKTPKSDFLYNGMKKKNPKRKIRDIDKSDSDDDDDDVNLPIMHLTNTI